MNSHMPVWMAKLGKIAKEGRYYHSETNCVMMIVCTLNWATLPTNKPLVTITELLLCESDCD